MGIAGFHLGYKTKRNDQDRPFHGLIFLTYFVSRYSAQANMEFKKVQIFSLDVADFSLWIKMAKGNRFPPQSQHVFIAQWCGKFFFNQFIFWIISMSSGNQLASYGKHSLCTALLRCRVSLPHV